MNQDAMPQVGDTCDVTITDIAFGGDGVARTPGGAVVFIPFTALGDRVEAVVTAARPMFLRADCVRICEPGPGRVAPQCPHFGVCGGCVYQHLDYETEMSAKASQLGDLLRRIGRLDALPEIEPLVPSPRDYAYRNKIRLEPIRAAGAPPAADDDYLDYGYHGRDNVTLIPIDRCPLAEDSLNSLRRKVPRTDWGRKNGRRDTPSPLTLRVTSGGDTHFYFGRAPKRIPWLHESLLGCELSVPLGSFWQVNHAVAESLCATLRQWYSASPRRALVDAYSGVGTFSLVVGEAAQYRVLIEADQQAADAARYNHESWGGLACRTISDTVERVLGSVLTTTSPADTAVILDPPRTGCHRKVIRSLVQRRPASVYYISCNASTLARDIRTLVNDGGYRLERLALFDMFPRTAHFETMALLQQ